EARRHGDRDRRRPLPRLQGGVGEGPRARVRGDRRDGEALLGRALPPRGELVAADPRRLRIHGGVRDLALLPRPEDPRDRRGHERGAAHGHRQAARPVAGTIPGVVLAHAAWSAPPAVLALTAASAALFLPGWLRLRRRGRRDLADWKRAALFALGLLVVLAGLVSPIHTIGENHLLSVHMLQH